VRTLVFRRINPDETGKYRKIRVWTGDEGTNQVAKPPRRAPGTETFPFLAPTFTLTKFLHRVKHRSKHLTPFSSSLLAPVSRNDSFPDLGVILHPARTHLQRSYSRSCPGLRVGFALQVGRVQPVAATRTASFTSMVYSSFLSFSACSILFLIRLAFRLSGVCIPCGGFRCLLIRFAHGHSGRDTQSCTIQRQIKGDKSGSNEEGASEQRIWPWG